MSQEFRGFSPIDPVPADLYDLRRLQDELGRFSSAVLLRLGSRVAVPRWNSSWDGRGGRDYFFDNFEFHVRGRPDPLFLGFFHYRRPDHLVGSSFQVWEREIDDRPIMMIPLSKIIADVNVANQQGQLSRYLDDLAGELRRELGLN